jgi:hypothetical protein
MSKLACLVPLRLREKSKSPLPAAAAAAAPGGDDPAPPAVAGSLGAVTRSGSVGDEPEGLRREVMLLSRLPEVPLLDLRREREG